MASSNTSRQSIEACSRAISGSDGNADSRGLFDCLNARLAVCALVAIWTFTGSSHPLTFRVRCPQIADNGPPTIIHMDVLDAHKLVSSSTQAAEDFQLHRIRLQ